MHIKNYGHASLHEVRQISWRIMQMRFRSKGSNLTLVSVYALQSGHTSDAKENFFDRLQSTFGSLHDLVLVGGGFNVRPQSIQIPL